MWVAELHGDYTRRFIKVFHHSSWERIVPSNVFHSGADVCSHFPRWFSGLCGCFKSLKTNTAKLEVYVLQNPDVIDWRVNFPDKPPWFAQLPVDMLSTLYCFLVKNELKTTHSSPKQALICRSAMFSFGVFLFISVTFLYFTGWTSYRLAWHVYCSISAPPMQKSLQTDVFASIQREKINENEFLTFVAFFQLLKHFLTFPPHAACVWRHKGPK